MRIVCSVLVLEHGEDHAAVAACPKALVRAVEDQVDELLRGAVATPRVLHHGFASRRIEHAQARRLWVGPGAAGTGPGAAGTGRYIWGAGTRRHRRRREYLNSYWKPAGWLEAVAVLQGRTCSTLLCRGAYPYLLTYLLTYNVVVLTTYLGNFAHLAQYHL